MNNKVSIHVWLYLSLVLRGTICVYKISGKISELRMFLLTLRDFE